VEQIRNKKEEQNESEDTPVSLGKKVNTLQKQLQDLEIENVLGPESLSSTGTPQGGLPKKLVTEIESFKSELKQDKAKEQQKSGTPGCVTYELFYKPEHAKFSELSKMSQLEERLQRLESTVGTVSPKLSVFSELSKDDKTLMSAVSMLKGKMALFDVNHVEHVDVRLQGVLHHISQVQEKKGEVKNAEKQTKVAELYDIVSKWDDTINVIPELVDRLQSMKTLHQQAAEFSQTLSHLDGAQRGLSTQVQEQGARLKQLDETFMKNLSVMESNCSKMETRIANLVAKFGKK